MKQIKIIIISYLYFFLCPNNFCQSKIYFDKDWKVSEKENAHFYRIINKKNDSLFYVKDFYINNVLQMDGHYSNIKKEVFEGPINWYDENGKITKSSTYKKGILHGITTVYLDDGKIDYTNEYKNGKVYEGLDIGFTEKRIYKKGKLVKKIKHNPPNSLYILSTTVYGAERDSVYWFTSKGKKIGFGIYKNHTIQDGLEVINDFSNTFFTNYIKGKKNGIHKVIDSEGTLVSQKLFKNDQLISDKTPHPITGEIITCIYKNNEAFEGRFFEYNPIYNYYDEHIFKKGKQVKKNRYVKENGKLKLSKTSFK